MNYNERMYRSLPNRPDTHIHDCGVNNCPICGSYEGDAYDCSECGYSMYPIINDESHSIFDSFTDVEIAEMMFSN